MNNTESSPKANEPDQASMIDRRGVIVGLSLAAGAAMSHFSTPRAIASPIAEPQFQRMIPNNVGGWASRKSAELVLPAEDEGQDKLYENLETRIYEGKGLPSMMVLIAYSSVQRNDVQVHRPEICYPASGFPILWTKPVSINVGSRHVYGRELAADRGGLTERIIYWVRVGKEFPIGWADQRLTMAISNAKGFTPDGLLFRVSTIENSPASSSEALGLFIRTFVAASNVSFRNTVLF